MASQPSKSKRKHRSGSTRDNRTALTYQPSSNIHVYAADGTCVDDPYLPAYSSSTSTSQLLQMGYGDDDDDDHVDNCCPALGSFSYYDTTHSCPTGTSQQPRADSKLGYSQDSSYYPTFTYQQPRDDNNLEISPRRTQSAPIITPNRLDVSA